MKNIKPAKFLTPDQVTTVTSSDTFESLLPKEFIHEAVLIQKYPEEIHILIKLSLPMLAEGFLLQKGSISGFASNSHDGTKLVLKTSNVAPFRF